MLGETIGSAAIDDAFKKLVLSRLKQADRVAKLHIELDDATWEMMKSKEFQNAKCDHGSPDDAPFFTVTIPKLSRAYVNLGPGTENGEMRFSRLVYCADRQCLFRIVNCAHYEQGRPAETVR